MLTKTDIAAIRTVIREEIEAESEQLKTDLQGEMKLFRMELSLRMDNLENRMKNLEITARKSEKELISIKKELKQVRKDINSLGKYSDEMHILLRNRVTQIEKRLDLQ